MTRVHALLPEAQQERRITVLQITSLPNAEKFLEVVGRSRGNVFLQLPDHTQCDLKRDHTARQIIRAMRPGRDGLCITLSDPRDSFGFMQYMMESARG